MMRVLATLLLSLTFLSTSVCAKEVSTQRTKVMVFTQLAKADYVLDAKRSKYPNADIDVYFVDQKQNIEDAINDNLPVDKLMDMTEEERVAFLGGYLKPLAEKKNLKLITSAAGVGLMKLYKIDQVPAILFDYEYVTVGMTLSESIALYNKKFSK